jgi:4-azaleucine resistance transporter AzlC
MIDFDRRLLRDVGALAAAVAVIGVSFGAVALAQGLPWWAPITMSLLVYAGGAQFLAIGLLAVANPVAAILGGLLINLRHLPFGLAVGASVSDTTAGQLRAAHLLTDETTAFTMAQSDPVARREVFWLVGSSLFLAWNLGTVLGVLVGSVVGDPNRFGLDAAFPAGLLALLLPALCDPGTRASAVIGAVVAVALTPFLPAGLPVLLSLVGLAATVVVWRARRLVS